MNVFFKKKDYISKNYSYKTPYPKFYITLNSLVIFLSILNLFFYKNYNITVWWTHFKLMNMNFNMVLMFLMMNYLYLLVSSTAYLQSYSYKSEFFFALMNLTILLPIIFFINTLFTFFFFIELNSSIIFYKFINSTSFFYKKGQNQYNPQTPKYYMNMLFFQYWAAFFSSMLFVYMIIIYIYMYSTTEWVVLNFLNSMQLLYLTTNHIITTVVSFVLMLSFLMKIGLTPMHLYKLEMYKGLPYLSIFFYTTFYFLVFFFFFLTLLMNYLGVFIMTYWYIFTLFLLLGIFYTMSLLFNVNLLKIFFAYSTMMNSLGFICAGFSILNS